MTLNHLFDETYPTTAGPRTLREIVSGDLPTVFVAYPMDFTTVCTKQLCSYRDDWTQLSALPCRWWGINQVSVEKHRKFKAEHRLPMELVTDEGGELLKALGLKSLLWTRRGFAVVSPQGEILGSSSVFPMGYPKSDEVRAMVEPLLRK